VLIEAFLDTDPESVAARTTYDRIAAAAPGAVVGGATAFDLAVEDAVFGDLWQMLVLLIAISYVVLFLVLRSVLLPVKAIVMNLLSVAAAYGVLVAVFQWGWLDWTGFDSPGYIATIVPALLLAITFGLSMDYEIFLLTRIREHHERHGDGQLAVAEGLVDSARVITSAALVMVAVFAAFAIAGSTTLQQLGIGLAVAIGLDATLVRLVLVPATMRLLGDWNWWLPGPFARLSAAPTRGGGERETRAAPDR
jgi:RND superfamily putative drug exporter